MFVYLKAYIISFFLFFIFVFFSSPSVEATTYYVSKNGSNSNGLTWATAWNELDQINWAAVLPGDNIEIDGGSSTMTYTSTLTVGANGSSGQPITIERSVESGHDGTVEIFGGRTFILPECYQSSYTYVTSGVRNRGIIVGNHSWIVVDGTKWRGIKIHGHNQYGLTLGTTADNIIVRYIDIYDNGNATLITNISDPNYNTWYPDLQGVNFGGTNNTFEKMTIHDNGQDAFQTGSALSNLTIRKSWLYNTRTHSAYSSGNVAWNYCRHSDGLQIFGGGTESGVTIEDTIFGPGLLQGVILGQTPSTVINNVSISNSLFINTANANILGYATTNPQNWTIDHVTSYINTNNDPILGGSSENISLDGANHTVSNTIVSNGRVLITATGMTYSNNCQFNLISGSINGTVANPLFTSLPVSNPPSLTDQINADFSLQSGSPCTGRGSRVTSTAQLFTLFPDTSPTPTPTPTPTLTPAPTIFVSVASSQNSNNYNATPKTCSNLAPPLSPNLFQISSTSNSATLYFSPLLSNTDRYYIAYGLTQKAEDYGVEFKGSNNGVQAYTIQKLKSNTSYYFKVRAGNGCMPGNWSNILKTKTSMKDPGETLHNTLAQSSINAIKEIVKKTKAIIMPSQTFRKNNTAPKKCIFWIFFCK